MSPSPDEDRSIADRPPLPDGARTITVEEAGLQLVTLPASLETVPEAWRDWVEAASPEAAVPTVWITFHRAHVIWRPGRAVVLATEDRLESAIAAVVEGARHEAALESIERAAAEGWDDLEADASDAFDALTVSAPRRAELRRRYRRTVELRARLVRIAPYLLSPLMHPPTLGSQIADRWRERLRMEARYEAVEAQLEVYHDVYDACGQRTSEAGIARTGHTLEWAILVVLGFQSILWLFEILTSLAAD